ncbi:hypothetical protein [Sphaerisporangium corydalis]|uniref:DUF2178 domain-containing protein n=1 Tax=Sphaerisporangium corydalis TaxID=1441875 RepID=A0ABV9EBX4_9ACTN|nr:hypothetical protein [Sphaerisporangium corydalis]
MGMSFEEKRAWIYAGMAVGVPAVYFVIVLGRLADTEAAGVAYVGPMLTAVGVSVAANIVATIVAAIVSPKDADKKDERDTRIHRHGQNAGYYVLAAGAVVALVLTMAGFAHFWIANALYLGFALDALTSSTVKIVAYHRGL